MSVANLDVTQRNNDRSATVRAGMRNSFIGLSFIQSPQRPNVDDQRLQQRKEQRELRRAERLRRQGACCWRVETMKGLRYRIVADLLCALTLLPGSIIVILLSFGYIYSEPSPSEPYPWLKYVMAASGCLLLLLYIAWLATAVCVYRKAARLQPADGTLCGHARTENPEPDDNAGPGPQEQPNPPATTARPPAAATPEPNRVHINITPPTGDRLEGQEQHLLPQS